LPLNCSTVQRLKGTRFSNVSFSHEFGRLPLETEFLCHFPTQRQRSYV